MNLIDPDQRELIGVIPRCINSGAPRPGPRVTAGFIAPRLPVVLLNCTPPTNPNGGGPLIAKFCSDNNWLFCGRIVSVTYFRSYETVACTSFTIPVLTTLISGENAVAPGVKNAGAG
jgi:hypothetical protein